MVLLQIGCISPLTHRHTHAASRGAICTKTTAAAEIPSVILLLDKAMPPIVMANNGCAEIDASQTLRAWRVRSSNGFCGLSPIFWRLKARSELCCKLLPVRRLGICACSALLLWLKTPIEWR